MKLTTCCLTANVHDWATWSAWSDCSASCGGKGYRARQRHAVDVNIRAEVSSDGLTGPAREHEHCNMQACPRTYAEPSRLLHVSYLNCSLVGEKMNTVLALCQFHRSVEGQSGD